MEIAPDSPAHELPWIVTFGPLNDAEDWAPVVCGPYERAHALALAESVVADEELMAVVEPIAPHLTIDQIRGDIAAARLAAAEDDEPDFEPDLIAEPDFESDLVAGPGFEPDLVEEPTPPPTPEQIRAGFARIAARLTRA
nr:hypothetical protein [Planosporangium thailandense]